MTYVKQRPKPTIEARQAKDKAEYERLVKEIKERLEHRSPGLFGWWDDVVDNVTDWVDEAVDTVNDVIDTYVWDTSESEAAVESWVRDTFNVPDEAGKGFIGEAWDKVTDWASDEYNEAVNIVTNITNEITNIVNEVTGKADQDSKDLDRDRDNIRPDPDPDKTPSPNYGGGPGAPVYGDGIPETGGLLDNIGAWLGVGFDAAMATIGGLPILIMDLKADLAGWFEIDIDKLVASWKAVQEKINLEGKL